MDTAILDTALITTALGAVGAAAAILGRRPRPPVEEEGVERPWKQRVRWATLNRDEQREAYERAADVTRRTLGQSLWDALMRDGYVDLPSASAPDTCYRLRPARRVEIRCATARRWHTRAYLCVYPTYELPALEFLAQLYVRLRDDEPRVLSTGHLQRCDGRIPNVF